MTKRRLADIEFGATSASKGPSVPLILLCALVSGVALGIGFDQRAFDRQRLDVVSSIALNFPESWASLRLDDPTVLPQLPIGKFQDWLARPMSREAANPGNDGTPMIAIVIEDLGADEAATRKAMALPAAVTLSFSPNPNGTPSLSRDAHAAGHPIMVHLQMQHIGQRSVEPMGLVPNLAPGELGRRVEWALDRVYGHEGANNHLGGRFTASRSALAPVMQTLAANRMYFLDSRTTQISQAEYVARKTGILTGSRDVALDSETAAGNVAAALARTEDIARQTGAAIAIGHPHGKTLEALKTWTASLEKKGIALVPVSRVLERRDGSARHPLLSTMFN